MSPVYNRSSGPVPTKPQPKLPTSKSWWYIQAKIILLFAIAFFTIYVSWKIGLLLTGAYVVYEGLKLMNKQPVKFGRLTESKTITKIAKETLIRAKALLRKPALRSSLRLSPAASTVNGNSSDESSSRSATPSPRSSTQIRSRSANPSPRSSTQIRSRSATPSPRSSTQTRQKQRRSVTWRDERPITNPLNQG